LIPLAVFWREPRWQDVVLGLVVMPAVVVAAALDLVNHLGHALERLSSTCSEIRSRRAASSPWPWRIRSSSAKVPSPEAERDDDVLVIVVTQVVAADRLGGLAVSCHAPREST
jgi:hypothetical protein